MSIVWLIPFTLLQISLTDGFVLRCANGEYTNDPYDCNAFYQCSNGVWIHRRCPKVLHWNRELNKCDWPGDANCELRETTLPIPTFTPPFPSTPTLFPTTTQTTTLTTSQSTTTPQSTTTSTTQPPVTPSPTTPPTPSVPTPTPTVPETTTSDPPTTPIEPPSPSPTSTTPSGPPTPTW